MMESESRSARAIVYEVIADITLRAPALIHDDDGLIADLAIDGDDLSLWMIPELERRLQRTTTQRDWDRVETVRDVIAVFESPRRSGQ